MLRSMPNLPFMTRMYQYHVRSKKPQKSGEVTRPHPTVPSKAILGIMATGCIFG